MYGYELWLKIKDWLKIVDSIATYSYRGIHADAIVYIFAHLHTTLRKERNIS